jgi:predicted O-methyltransferase YrrM
MATSAPRALSPLAAGLAAAAASALAAALAAYLLHYRRPAPQAKSRAGGTLCHHPSSYAYLLQHIGEGPGEARFRLAMEGQARARMLGAPDEAALLRWLCEALGARRVLEVGVFRGTTTLQLARAVGPAGKVYALDVDGSWLAAGGRAAWEAEGVSDRIMFVQGPAEESMEHLLAGGDEGAFDLVFIDADKLSYDAYYEKGLALLRSGGILAVDNVLWDGKAQAPPAGDAESQSISRLNEKIRGDARVAAVMLGIADGVYLCRKL